MKYSEGFKNPDRKYAIYPIIHGGAANPQSVERHDELGYAGIVGNVPYTLSFPNNKQEWLDTEKGFRAYIDRGMYTWIYDEDGYPSGTAGGYVTEFHPEFVAKGLYCYDYWRVVGGPSVYRADVPGDKLWKAVLIPTNGGEIIDVTGDLNENGVLYAKIPKGTFWLFMMSIRRLFDGTHATESYSEPRNYISLSDKNATEAFIACTHEKYKEYLGDEFGKGIRAMFTDEPSLISWNIRSGVFPILPWLDSYPEDFEKRYGYEFVKACVAVAVNKGPEIIKRRCDFWEFIADTVAEGFFGTIREWCHKNGLKSSGHMLREETLQCHVLNYGSFLRSLKKLDWPGIDMLDTEPHRLMDRGSIPVGRLVASVADISGEHEVFTEFSDHCVRMRNAVATVDMYYDSVNWHLAMGVNNFTSYYSWNGITDEEIKALNKYTARLGYMLRQGNRDSKIAIFYPEASMWAAQTPSTAANAIDHSSATVELDKAFADTSWAVLDRQGDFDYIDLEVLLAGDVNDGKLCLGDRKYSVVVLPCTRVLENTAMEKLLRLADSGCKVIFTVASPEKCRETGENSETICRLNRYISEGKIFTVSIEGFGKLIDFNADGRYKSVSLETSEKNILSHVRVTENGEKIVFLANMTGKDYNGNIGINGYFCEVFSADPNSGDIEACESNIRDGKTFVAVKMTSHESKLLILK